MNNWVGGNEGAYGGWSGPEWKVYLKMDDFIDPGPTLHLFCSTSAKTASTTRFGSQKWPAIQARRRPRSSIIPLAIIMAPRLSFADGHSEIHKWLDPRTVPKLKRGQNLALNIASPNNVDMTWTRDHSTRKKQLRITAGLGQAGPQRVRRDGGGSWHGPPFARVADSRPLAFIRGAPAGRTVPGPLICDHGFCKALSWSMPEGLRRGPHSFAFIGVHSRCSGRRNGSGPLICDQGSKKPCAAPCREAALRSAFIRVHWRSFAVSGRRNGSRPTHL